MDGDGCLVWLSTQPPEIRRVTGFIEYHFHRYPVPRMFQDEAYMSGWREAERIGDKSNLRAPFSKG